MPGLSCLKKESWKNGHLWTKNKGQPLWKNVNFSTFSTCCFYSIKRRFFVLQYHKRHFPGLSCLKKQSWKNGHLWTKNKDQPLWKNVNFSTFSISCFYSLKRRFLVLEYRKRYFSGLYCLKEKVGKMAIFGPKQWVNPFGKMSIFQLFQLRVFIA